MDTNPLNEGLNETGEHLLEMAPEYSLYSLNQLALASFLGGPFAGFYMIYFNLRKLELNSRIWPAAAIVFGVVLLSYLPDIFGYEFNLPGMLSSLVFAVATYYAGKNAMELPLAEHEKSGGQFFGGGRVALVIIVSIILMLMVIALGLILTDFEGFKSFINE